MVQIQNFASNYFGVEISNDGTLAVAIKERNMVGRKRIALLHRTDKSQINMNGKHQ